MPRLNLLLLILLSLAPFCSSQTDSEPQFKGSLVAPRYAGGYVFDWDPPQFSRFFLYGPDTKPLYSLPARGGDHIVYTSWTADVDGTVAQGYWNPEWRGRIDVIDTSGKALHTIDTGSYMPTRVTFGPDRTIWAVGFVAEYDSQGEDFNVIRHYTRTGEQLGQALPWSQIAENHNAYTALQGVIGGIWLFSAGDRIGFLSLCDVGRAKWIEVSFDGKLLGQYGLGSYGILSFQPRAMTSSGNVYASRYQDGSANGYAVLDRSTGTWNQVTGYPKGELIGTDGDNLVFSQRDGGWTVLHQVASAALTVQKTDLTASTRAAEYR